MLYYNSLFKYFKWLKFQCVLFNSYGLKGIPKGNFVFEILLKGILKGNFVAWWQNIANYIYTIKGNFVSIY